MRESAGAPGAGASIGPRDPPAGMSASADMSASSCGIASGTRGASLDVTGPSGGPVPLGGRHGSCLWCVIMSGAARHRDGWVPVFLLAAFFVFTLGSGVAWPAVGGGHAGGHAGGFAGGGHPGGGRPGGGRPGGSFPRGREFGGGRFGGRPFLHGPRGFVFPYFYDPYYGYDPYAAYCDPYAPSYAPQYCYWDGP